MSNRTKTTEPSLYLQQTLAAMKANQYVEVQPAQRQSSTEQGRVLFPLALAWQIYSYPRLGQIIYHINKHAHKILVQRD